MFSFVLNNNACAFLRTSSGFVILSLSKFVFRSSLGVVLKQLNSFNITDLFSECPIKRLDNPNSQAKIKFQCLYFEHFLQLKIRSTSTTVVFSIFSKLYYSINLLKLILHKGILVYSVLIRELLHSKRRDS